jgi:hypothetical protein
VKLGTLRFSQILITDCSSPDINTYIIGCYMRTSYIPPQMILWIDSLWSLDKSTHITLGALSHTRLKPRDRCNLRALIGRKGVDCSSSLHTRRWRPKGSKKTSWVKSLHGVLHGILWTRFHGLPEFLFNIWRNFWETMTLFDNFSNMIDSMVDSRIYTHHQVILSDW